MTQLFFQGECYPTQSLLGFLGHCLLRICRVSHTLATLVTGCVTYSAVSHFGLVSEEPLSQVLPLLVLLPVGIERLLLGRV